MSSVHLYTAPTQPATCFVDNNIDPPMTITFTPRQLIYTDCCHKRRWARSVVVQVYWDGLRRWCADGHGCKKGKR
jgi:hypothetical protein